MRYTLNMYYTYILICLWLMNETYSNIYFNPDITEHIFVTDVCQYHDDCTCPTSIYTKNDLSRARSGRGGWWPTGTDSLVLVRLSMLVCCSKLEKIVTSEVVWYGRLYTDFENCNTSFLQVLLSRRGKIQENL